MLEKLFHNADLDVELTSFIDNKQNVWFKGKDIAALLGYSDTDQALRKHTDTEDRKSYPVKTTGQVRWYTFINESGFYSLVLSSKLETAKKIKHWVTSQVLHSSENMGSTNYLTIPVTKCSRLKMRLICTAN